MQTTEPGDDARAAKRLRRGIALALVLSTLGSVGLVLFGGGLGQVLPALRALPLRAVLLCGLAVFVEWSLDGLRFAVIARVLGVRAEPWFWLRLALAYLAATYGTNLGALACAWMLGRRGVAAGPAFAIAFGKQLLYVPAVLLPTWLLVTWGPGLGAEAGRLMRGVGVGSLSLSLVIAFVAFKPERLTRAFERFAKGRPQAAVAGFSSSLRAFVIENPRTLAGSLVLASVNQVAAVSALVALLGGLGVSTLDAGVWLRTLAFATLSQSSPTPGGAGVAEVSGVLLLRPLLPASALAGFLVVGRFFATQLPILLGTMVIVSELRSKRTNDASPP